MVPIKGEWTRFADRQDQLDHYRLWGLIPEKSKSLRPVMVVDGYFDFPKPCQVVGYQTDKVAVIELADGFHAVRGEHLTELQPEAHQRLPRGLCFVEILSNYVVVDIETTGFNRHHDRIIEIAAARYEYGQQIDTFQTFVNPCMLIPSDIEKLTGITQQNVDVAPELSTIIPEFLNYIGSLPVIGHNAVSFDIPFLAEQMQVDFTNPIIDTLPMARKVYHLLPHHKLEYLKTALELNDGASHRALADVETTNALLWACLAPRHYESKMWHAVLYKMPCETSTKPEKQKNTSQHSTFSKPKNAFGHIDIKSITPTCCANGSHPLCGKVLVFTGELSLSREEAMQLAVNCGAILKTSVSSKTDYLIVGRQDKELVGEDGMSTKEEKATALNRAGKANIKVLSEEEFLDMVNTKCEPLEMEQMDLFTSNITEDWVYGVLKDSLSLVITQNNVDHNRLKLKEGKSYSSVWYDTQMAFRICCRENHYYFSVSNLYSVHAPENLQNYITLEGRSDGFTNFHFVPSLHGIMEFASFLSSVLDMAIDSIAKEFDCCSRYEQCSNAKQCINPNVAIATGCGYRRIMKKGRIFYGKNRNID